MLRKPLLEQYTCLNIHASLLPKYRGAAPIERAIMAGENTTGVCVMRITEALDAGPWADRVEISLGQRQDAGSMLRLLAFTGAAALAGVLDAIEDGTVHWREQEGEATYAHKLTSSDTWLDVSGSAKAAHDQVRALSPAVGVRALMGESEVKIWRTWPYGDTQADEVPHVAAALQGRPGEVHKAAGRLFVGCGEGLLEVIEIQPSCRARMSTREYLRGYADSVGTQLKTRASG
jgi:methionyl-tRNA formyltransferase